MPINQPMDFSSKQNKSHIDDESSLYKGKLALSKYIRTLENSTDLSVYNTDYEKGSEGEKYVNRLKLILKDLELYPSIGVKLIEYMNSGVDLKHAEFRHVRKVVEELESIFKSNLPKVDKIKLDSTQFEFADQDDEMKDQLGYASLIQLKALGPETCSMRDISHAIIEPILKDTGGLTKQSMAVKMDKLSRGKKINLDLRLSNKNDAGHIYREFARDYSTNALRIRDIIKDSEYSFANITGRDMKDNEFDLMVSNLEDYVAKFEEIKDETFDDRVEMMNKRKTPMGLRALSMKKQKVEDLVSLVKKCKEFVAKNGIYSKFSEVENRRYVVGKDGVKRPRASLEEFESKSEIVDIVKDLSGMIDKCQDFLLEVGDPNFSKNYIKENSVASKTNNQSQSNANFRSNPSNETGTNIQNNVSNYQINEQTTRRQDEIPNFQKMTSSVEKKIESVENIDQFVNKYFKDFDAFLVSEISKAKINNEEVLKFTGQDHKEEGVKNGYTKVPIQGLSKFELQTIGKIAEKYNTVEGVQIWIGNGQIGIMSASGEMLELLS
jgi:hypothetical protein